MTDTEDYGRDGFLPPRRCTCPDLTHADMHAPYECVNDGTIRGGVCDACRHYNIRKERERA